MTWPAYFDLMRERNASQMAHRVYMHVTADNRVFREPRPFKESGIGANRKRVRTAYYWLVTHGYLIECGRGANNVRLIMAAHHRDLGQNVPAKPAA